MELVSEVAIEKRKKCLMEIILWTLIFGIPRITVVSWKQNMSQCVIREKKRLADCLPFCQLNCITETTFKVHVVVIEASNFLSEDCDSKIKIMIIC